jgi:DNA-directed RNA polymerase, mitochondrial
MKELHENPNNKVYLPVFQDATCSGIQHLAALLKDFETGSKVNLIPQTIDDNVGDIYSDLIIPINEAINKHGVNHIEYEKFKDIKLERKHIKTPIMTKTYNVLTVGIAEQLRSNFDKVKNNQTTNYLVPGYNGLIEISYQEVYVLAQIINDQIFKLLPSLQVIYNYLNDIIKITNKLNLPTV